MEAKPVWGDLPLPVLQLLGLLLSRWDLLRARLVCRVWRDGLAQSLDTITLIPNTVTPSALQLAKSFPFLATATILLCSPSSSSSSSSSSYSQLFSALGQQQKLQAVQLLWQPSHIRWLDSVPWECLRGQSDRLWSCLEAALPLAARRISALQLSLPLLPRGQQLARLLLLLPLLQRLTLTGGSAKAVLERDHLQALALATGLRQLSMSGTYVRSDSELSVLSRLAGLTGLVLRGQGETSRRVLPLALAALTRLQAMSLSGYQLQPLVAWLQPLTGLQQLELDQPVNVEDLNALTGLAALTKLMLNKQLQSSSSSSSRRRRGSSYVLGAGLLGAWAGQQPAQQQQQQQQEDPTRVLLGLTQLQALNARVSGPEILASLAGLTNLRQLAVAIRFQLGCSNGAVAPLPSALLALTGLSALTSFCCNADGCSTDEAGLTNALTALAASWPDLRALHFTGEICMTQSGFRALARFRVLEDLKLVQTGKQVLEVPSGQLPARVKTLNLSRAAVSYSSGSLLQLTELQLNSSSWRAAACSSAAAAAAAAAEPIGAVAEEVAAASSSSSSSRPSCWLELLARNQPRGVPQAPNWSSSRAAAGGGGGGEEDVGGQPQCDHGRWVLSGLNVQILHLDSCGVTAQDLMRVAATTGSSLQDLTLTQQPACAVTSQEGLEALLAMQRLQSLKLHLHGPMPEVDAHQLAAALGQLPLLQQLSFKYSGASSSRSSSSGSLAVSTFAGLTRLRRVELIGDFCVGGDGGDVGGDVGGMVGQQPYRRLRVETAG